MMPGHGSTLGFSGPRHARRFRTVLAGVAGALTLPACGRDAGPLDPPRDAPADSSGVAAVTFMGNPGPMTVLGSTARLSVRARDSADTTVCGTSSPGCASWLLSESFQWEMDVPGIVSLREARTSLYPNGGANLTALADGRVEVIASVAGVADTAVVDVVERARAAWSLPLTGFIKGIAIGEDGTLYVADIQSLHAVGAQGDLRWSVPSYLSGGTPGIAADGTLYLGAFSDGLRAIDPDGNVLWVVPVERIWSPPAIGPDGTIYQVNGNGTLYAVDPTGQIEWQFDAPGGLSVNNQPPAIAADGTIYFGSEDHHLYAIAPDGGERWRFANAGVVRSPSIGTDGTIYFANDRITEWRNDAGLVILADSRMFALNPDGTARWSAPLEGDASSGPAIGFDGSIYQGTVNGGGLYVFAPDGSLLRKAGAGSGPTPMLASDGSIYRGGSATDGDGTPRWSFQPAGGAGATPAIGFDGRIYVGANVGGETNRLFAFEELDGTHGDYHGSPWPQERGDRANTGRARAAPGPEDR